MPIPTADDMKPRTVERRLPPARRIEYPDPKPPKLRPWPPEPRPRKKGRKGDRERPLTNEEIRQLREMPYEAYLKTRHWIETRRRAHKHYDGRCSYCNTNERIEVHHKTYVRRGCERMSDLMLLCRDCHKEEHGLAA